jgi:hypothetical protein
MRAVSDAVSSMVCGLGCGLMCNRTAVSAVVSGCGPEAVGQRSRLSMRQQSGPTSARGSSGCLGAAALLRSPWLRTLAAATAPVATSAAATASLLRLRRPASTQHTQSARAHGTKRVRGASGSKMLTHLLSTRRDELIVDHPQTGPRPARLRKANLAATA